MSGRKKKTRKRVREPEPMIVIPPRDPGAPPLHPPQASRPLRPYIGLITSIALHTAILLLGIASWSVGKQVVAKVQEQIVIPDATIIEGAEVGGVPNPGIGGDPTRSAASDVGADIANSDAWAKRPSRELQATILGDTDASENAIGLGSRSLGGASGIGSGASGGAAAPFGVPGGGAAVAPISTFMGVSGNAKKIVYVCDCSGSMADRMNILYTELERSVSDLKPIQAFNAIFFSEERPQALNTELVAANTRNKDALKNFLETVKISRGSDPRPSLRMAFVEKPDLIYLLTDGDFNTPEDGEGPRANATVIKEIRWLNREKRVKINTIAFSSAAPDSEIARGEYTDVLKLIASESGGNYRFVSTRQIP